MKISVIKNLEIPGEVSNDFAFKYLKLLVRSELHQIDVLKSLMDDELSDEEYLEKAKEIYYVELDENDTDIDVAKEVRKATVSRLKSDREALSESLKERLEYLKRSSIESSELTRERLNIEEQTAGYCDTLLNGFAKEKKQLHN